MHSGSARGGMRVFAVLVVSSIEPRTPKVCALNNNRMIADFKPAIDVHESTLHAAVHNPQIDY
eukprot:m.22302 g.22302  ORF g.22302 m.22302 type:complete len:63 (-) comp5789_c0_seq2:301-489(-)